MICTSHARFTARSTVATKSKGTRQLRRHSDPPDAAGERQPPSRGWPAIAPRQDVSRSKGSHSKNGGRRRRGSRGAETSAIRPKVGSRQEGGPRERREGDGELGRADGEFYVVLGSSVLSRKRKKKPPARSRCVTAWLPAASAGPGCAGPCEGAENPPPWWW